MHWILLYFYLSNDLAFDCYVYDTVKGNVVRINVYHKYIKDLKLNITIDLDGFIY